MTLKLIIGNKNYSSWSFRPWIAMKVAGIAFDEEVISLDADDFKARVDEGFRHRQGAGARPTATCMSGSRWRSSNISPRNFRRPASGRPIRRRAAHARAIAAEMHAGFVPLRRASADEHVAAGQAARAHARGGGQRRGASTRMWTDCRTRFGAGGPFLFGALRRGRRDVRPGCLPLSHLCRQRLGRSRAPIWTP